MSSASQLSILALLVATVASARPNFVVLFLDDHGWGDGKETEPREVSTSGGTQVAFAHTHPHPPTPSTPTHLFAAGVNDASVTETPHIDALAKGGMRFTDMHAGFSVCTPSRAALLTGRLAPRTGVSSNFGDDSTHGLPLTERTIADLLEPAGWESHHIGKWYRVVLDGCVT